MAKILMRTRRPQARHQRTNVSAQESLKQVQEFYQRKGQLIASVRKDKTRGLFA